jgi:hypothetical protein
VNVTVEDKIGEIQAKIRLPETTSDEKRSLHLIELERNFDEFAEDRQGMGCARDGIIFVESQTRRKPR